VEEGREGGKKTRQKIWSAQPRRPPLGRWTTHLVVDDVELLLEVLPVRLPAVELERTSGFGSVPDGLVELLEDGLVGGVELGGPVEGTSSSGGGAGLIRRKAKRRNDESERGPGGKVSWQSWRREGRRGREETYVVHVVHAVLADQGEERLGGLLDGLVEGLGGGVSVLSENLVLGEEHSLDTSHELSGTWK
jgi:hypothetical protein